MRVVIVLSLLAVMAAATSVQPLTEAEGQFLFSSFQTNFNVSFETVEEMQEGFKNFMINVHQIRQHQANPNRKWEMGVNKFTHLSAAAFKQQNNGYRHIANDYLRSKNTKKFSLVGLPATVNWVSAGKVSGVKDQGQCGSCWSFSTTGAVESAFAIENGASPPSLSEQELVDCSGSAGNQGCNGGMMDQAFGWIESNGGLCTESAYPYQAVQGSCQSSSCSSSITISGYTDVTAYSESQLQAALAQQPVSVAVDASQGWQTYTGGIIDSGCGCSTNLDHGVLLVGYGTDGGEAYWTIKNSWGTSWGENGYIRLKRNVGGAGTCGLASTPSYPTGARSVSSRRKRLFL